MNENTEMHDRQQWDSLFAAYYLAAQAHDATSEANDPSTYERVCKLRHDAWDTLILAPAPDFAALGWKINELFGEEAMTGEQGDPTWGRSFTDAIAADAKRLGAPPCTTPDRPRFDAHRWIEDWVEADGGWVCMQDSPMLCASVPATTRQTVLLCELRDMGGSDTLREVLLTRERLVH